MSEGKILSRFQGICFVQGKMDKTLQMSQKQRVGRVASPNLVPPDPLLDGDVLTFTKR